jgi:hypothetical protein
VTRIFDVGDRDNILWIKLAIQRQSSQITTSLTNQRREKGEKEELEKQEGQAAVMSS